MLNKKKNKLIKRNRKLILFSGFFVVLLFIFIGHITFAGKNYVLLEQLPGLQESTSNINDYLKALFKLGVGIGATLAVLMIVLGGFKYIISELPDSKGDGKQMIQNAVFGLLMILVSWLILYTINPDLTLFRTEFNPVKIKIPTPQKQPSPAVEEKPTNNVNHKWYLFGY